MGQMAVDWLADVRIYDADADESVVNKIANYCGIALQSRDGQLVAMADPKECETVRENFLKKKLGLSESDATLDEAIQSVRETMKEDRTKNRVTVYYLLSKHFGMLNMFGGAAGVAGLAAAALSGDKDEGGSVAPLAAAAGLAGAGIAAVTGAASSAGAAVSGAVSGAADFASDAASGAVDAVSGAAAAPLAAVRSSFDDDDSSSSWGWLKWLLLAALLAALLFFLLKSCTGQEATPVAEPDAATVDAGATATTEPDPAAATATTAVAAPAGAGVTAGERNGKPMLTVYFDTGKSDVTADLAAAAAKVKAFVAANAGAKLGVSGFNDPTGNAAANAELSKKRAQAVGKALEGVGIPAASIEMVKPAESTDTKVDNNAARRVEVVVQ
jgi:outer membrane protein OmpA-like peptidoglycan-associated protein